MSLTCSQELAALVSDLNVGASMIALLDNGQDLAECEAELGNPVGQLLTPLTRYVRRDLDRPWAIDNGAYANFNRDAFLSLLAREQEHKQTCLFVAVPDVVGSGRRTLEVFAHWQLQLTGWPLALVCQDGQEHLPIPWSDICAVFIGGSTNWKCSHHAAEIVKAAKAIGKWVHAGRINHGNRWDHFEKLGTDSIDGTGISRFSHMRKSIANRHAQENLCLSYS